MAHVACANCQSINLFSGACVMAADVIKHFFQLADWKMVFGSGAFSCAHDSWRKKKHLPINFDNNIKKSPSLQKFLFRPENKSRIYCEYFDFRQYYLPSASIITFDEPTIVVCLHFLLSHLRPDIPPAAWYCHFNDAHVHQIDINNNNKPINICIYCSLSERQNETKGNEVRGVQRNTKFIRPCLRRVFSFSVLQMSEKTARQASTRQIRNDQAKLISIQLFVQPCSVFVWLSILFFHFY